MVDFTVQEITSDPTSGMLAAFKEYASVPDSSRDALLTTLLRTALLKVQEYANRPLMGCKCRQIVTVPVDSGIVRLYLGGGTVVSIKDEITGEDVPYDPLTGGRLLLYTRGRSVAITYTVASSSPDVSRLTPVVYRYATALYDGEDTEVLNGILNEALC